MTEEPRVYFDVCDIEDADRIPLIPQDLLLQNPHTGRIILRATDPLVTQLCLLGLRPVTLVYEKISNSKKES